MKPTDSSTGQAVAALLNGPFEAARDFVTGGTAIGEVYGMAAWLRTRLSGSGQRGTVCLATDNRALIAAALRSSDCTVGHIRFTCPPPIPDAASFLTIMIAFDFTKVTALMPKIKSGMSPAAGSVFVTTSHFSRRLRSLC